MTKLYRPHFLPLMPIILPIQRRPGAGEQIEILAAAADAAAK